MLTARVLRLDRAASNATDIIAPAKDKAEAYQEIARAGHVPTAPQTMKIDPQITQIVEIVQIFIRLNPLNPRPISGSITQRGASPISVTWGSLNSYPLVYVLLGQ